MQEWLRYTAEHNIPVYNVYMQCYYIGNVGRKMIIMDRTRRLRMNATLRDMVRENHVREDELIYPVFVTEENDVIQEVPSMPGICQYSLDHVLEEIGRAVEVGIKGILLLEYLYIKMRSEVRHMTRKVLCAGQSALLRMLIQSLLSWLMCACVSTHHMDTADL